MSYQARILVIDDEEDFREILTFAISSRYKQIEILEASSGTEGMETIEANPDLDLVICDYHMPRANGGKVFEYLKSRHEDIPFALCTTESPTNLVEFQERQPDHWLEKPSVLKPASVLIDEILATKSKKPEKYGEEELCRVRVKTLFRLEQWSTEIYMISGEGEKSKVFDPSIAGEELDLIRDVIKRVEFVYIPQKGCQTLVPKFAAILERLYQIRQDLGAAESAGLSQEALEVVHRCLTACDIAKEAKAIVDASIQLTLDTIRANPKLSEIMDGVSKDEGEYITAHSVLLSYIAGAIAYNMKWEDERTHFKLCMAAFMHDMSVSNPKLAQYDDIKKLHNDFSSLGVSNDEVIAYQNHPELSTEVLKNFPDVPTEVAVLIREHHERPDGSGFPNRLNHEKISLLSALFIVAHVITDFLMLAPDSTHRRAAFIDETKKRFKSGHFADVAKSLDCLK